MRFLTDENFDGRIFNGLCRRQPHIEIQRVQDVGLSGARDMDVLAWAAEHDCVVLTHDVSTMVADALERVSHQLPMPGLIVVPLHMRIREAVDDILMIEGASSPEEWVDLVTYLPL